MVLDGRIKARVSGKFAVALVSKSNATLLRIEIVSKDPVDAPYLVEIQLAHGHPISLAQA